MYHVTHVYKMLRSKEHTFVAGAYEVGNYGIGSHDHRHPISIWSKDTLLFSQARMMRSKGAGLLQLHLSRRAKT